ncbi:MAG: rhomboid family intramembrane serine protease [Armatimonadetes bacterium]|nr:rhomboid family intramembrane serine protease [Armatimonadota bacterium]
MLITLPYGTNRPARVFPIVTYTLLALNLLIYLATSQGGDLEEIIVACGFTPAHLNTFSWFTYMFLHGSLLHVLGNMLYLWLFGCALECAMGWWLYLATYLLSGCFAMMLHFLIVASLDPASAEIPLVGASGAIAGLLGLFILRFYQTKIKVGYTFLFIKWGTFEVPSMWFIGFWILRQLWGALHSTFMVPAADNGVAYWTHIGGVGLGMLYGLLVNLQGEGKTEYLVGDAQSAFDSGSYAKSIELTGKVLKTDPHNQQARLMNARSLARFGLVDKAMAGYHQVLGEHLRRNEREQVVALYSEMSAVQPEVTLEARTQLAVASWLTQSQKVQEAVTAYETLIRKFPQSPEAETALLRCAQLYLEHYNRPHQAIATLETFIRKYPTSAWRGFAQESLNTARRKAAASG